jgi:hypothetical protein
MRTALLLLVLAASSAAAEAPARDVWVLQLENPAREYAVRIGALQTVTLQDYDMRRDGQLQRVVSMTVETAGGNQARFFWEDEPQAEQAVPGDLQERQRELTRTVRELTGRDVEKEAGRGDEGRVVKDYPVTTHTGWTEFRLGSEAEVRELHRKLMDFWTGQSRP